MKETNKMERNKKEEEITNSIYTQGPEKSGRTEKPGKDEKTRRGNNKQAIMSPDKTR